MSNEGEMVYSMRDYCYFDSIDDAVESLEDGETLADLRLVTCEPLYADPLSIDYWGHQLPEDAEDVPQELFDAIDTLNAVVATLPPLSYVPTGSPVEVPA